MACFRNEVICGAEKLSLGDGLSCSGHVVCILVDTYIEDLGWIVWVAGLPKVGVILSQVCFQYLVIIPMHMDNKAHCWERIVP